MKKQTFVFKQLLLIAFGVCSHHQHSFMERIKM